MDELLKALQRAIDAMTALTTSLAVLTLATNNLTHDMERLEGRLGR